MFSPMDSKLAAELERLLSELADEGATQQRVEKIERLLLNNPKLQDHYWSWMDNHIILGTDRAAILGESKAANHLISVGSQQSPAAAIAVQPFASEQNSLRRWLTPLLAISACLLWMMLPGNFSLSHIAGLLRPHVIDTDHTDSWHIPRITRVSWEGPYFAEHEQRLDSGSKAHVGLVSLGFVNGSPANGYVLRLEPGTSAELMMAADAYAENNLSVTELNASGKPVRRSVSFNNFGSGGISASANHEIRARRYGLIGTWSEFNDSNKPKYYLINGIHKSINPDLSPPHPEQEFQLSRMALVLDEPDLKLLGWDDSGIEPNEVNAGVEPDGDYDDISVAIRISGKGIEPKFSDKDCRLVATPGLETTTPRTDGANCYRFTLGPGEIAVLKVASEARKTNSLFVVREGSNEVLWNVASNRPGTVNLGAVAIQNTSYANQNYVIFGENSADPLAPPTGWQNSSVATVHTQPGCSILGFEDDEEEGQDSDFDDIRITFLSISPNQGTPFEKQ
jgi:hypothetical protein